MNRKHKSGLGTKRNGHRAKRERRGRKSARDKPQNKWLRIVGAPTIFARQARSFVKVLNGLVGDLTKLSVKVRPFLMSVAASAIVANHILLSIAPWYDKGNVRETSRPIPISEASPVAGPTQPIQRDRPAESVQPLPQVAGPDAQRLRSPYDIIKVDAPAVF
jgi:hypothetical protein